MSSHLILFPLAFVFWTILDLFKFSVSMKHSYQKFPFIKTTIWKDFFTCSIRLIILKLSFIYSSIRKLKSSLTFFSAIFPFSCISSPICPLTYSNSIHFPSFPLSIIFPSLNLTNKKTRSLLISLKIFTFIVVSICPFSYSKSPRKSMLKFSWK